MPVYSYKKVKELELMNDGSQARINALFLGLFDQIPMSAAAYKLAATELDSTPESVRVMLTTWLKRLREKGCVVESENDGEGVELPPTPKTPKKQGGPKKAGGTKRKAEDVDDSATTNGSANKVAKKSQKAAATAGANEMVTAEAGGESA